MDGLGTIYLKRRAMLLRPGEVNLPDSSKEVTMSQIF
jgi:hypothetical protein